MGGGVANIAQGETEVNRMLFGAGLMTFSAALLDMATYIAVGKAVQVDIRFTPVC